MTQWMQQILWCSLAMSVMVLVYYAATLWLRKRYASKWFYVSGVILLIGFLIPFRFDLTVRIEKMPEFLQGIANQAALAPYAGTPAQGQQLPGTIAFPWRIAFIVWVAGVFGVMIYHAIRHLRFVRAVKRWCANVEDSVLLEQFARAKGELLLEGRKIALIHCACVSSPMLLWLSQPTILLPENTPADSGSRFMLLHELIHYKRRDLLCRLVMLASTAMHWFNPAVYLLVKLVTLQCEISCDEKVVENQSMEGRHEYAMSILCVARYHVKGYSLLTTHFNGGKNTMKKRIDSIYDQPKSKTGVLLLACVLLVTLLAGTSIAADTADGGPIRFTLPEAPIKFGETVSSYAVSWEPLEGIKEYHVGMYFEFRTEGWGTDPEKTNEIRIVADGWMGGGTVADNDGVTYNVDFGCWGSITLDGGAAEVDLSDLVNKQLDPILYTDPETKAEAELKREGLLGCTLVMVAVRESGEPICMQIELPVQ